MSDGALIRTAVSLWNSYSHDCTCGAGTVEVRCMHKGGMLVLRVFFVPCSREKTRQQTSALGTPLVHSYEFS
eukprot:1915114-Amphidinium_carterae.1